MELVQNNRSFEGEQRIYSFESKILKKPTRFGIFLPPQALEGQNCPALFYLAGLTCTEETFAIKAHAQRLAAQLGLHQTLLRVEMMLPKGTTGISGRALDSISMPLKRHGLNIIRWKALLSMSCMNWCVKSL